LHGGLYVYGLCVDCNGAAGRYDAAYGELAKASRSCWSSGLLTIPSGRISLPVVQFSPGAVARSVLMGLFGINHSLQQRFPALAADLLDPTSTGLALPAALRLRLALSSGSTGRLTGATLTSLVLPPTNTGLIRTLMSDGSVYFPPLAWHLAAAGDSQLLDDQGWADVSDWLAYDPSDRHDLSTLCPSLPVVLPMTHDPDLADRLMHLFSGELTPIVECHGLRPPWLGN
jgi:hypothetical protein